MFSTHIYLISIYRLIYIHRKECLFLEFIATKCQSSTHIFKGDDDIIMNPRNLMHLVDTHKDKNNIGESYIIGLGDYEGGRIKVWHNENEEPEYVDIKNKFYKFNGAKLYHETEDFTGTRLSLVYFNLLNEQDKEQV